VEERLEELAVANVVGEAVEGDQLRTVEVVVEAESEEYRQ
jgi:hypothetical protein